MGIPGFSAWITNEFPNTYIPPPHGGFDNVYIDINAVAHTAVRATKFANTRRGGSAESTFFSTLFSRLDAILRVTKPKQFLMLAVDGAAPHAKVTTQRQRRQKEASRTPKGGPSTFSTTSLSPGTELMAKLTHGLEYYAATRLLTQKNRFTHCIVSPHTDPGEGELKIQDAIIDINDGSHALVGSDADFILMALSTYVDDVYVVTDNQKTSSYRCFSTNSMVEALSRANPANPNVQLDFVTLSLFSGNDYLPALRTVKMKHLWQIYCKQAAGQPLLKEGKFEPAFFKFMKAVVKATPAINKKLSLGHGETGNYLEALQWNLSMYVNGQCPDMQFVLPHTQPGPSPRDILHWWAVEQAAGRSGAIKVPSARGAALTMPECLLALMPEAAAKLMPRVMQPLVHEQILAPLYKAERCTECKEARLVLKRDSERIAALRVSVKEMEERLEGSKKTALELKITTMKDEIKSVKAQYAIANDRYTAHRELEHSEPLPWSTMQQVAEDVPLDALSERELEQLTPAHPKIFWNSQGQEMPNPYLTRSGKLNRCNIIKSPVHKWRPIQDSRLRVGAVVPIPIRDRRWSRGFSSSRSGHAYGSRLLSSACVPKMLRNELQQGGASLVKKVLGVRIKKHL